MRVGRWIRFLSAVALAVGLGFSPLVVSADGPADLEIEIVSSRVEMVAGVEGLWQVRLQVPADQRIQDLRLRPADPAAWHWPDGELELGDVAASRALSEPVVPLAAGALYPSLEAEYVLDGVTRTQIALGTLPILVVPVSQRVTVQTWSGASTVDYGQAWAPQVCVRNEAGLTLANVTVRGLGSGLDWPDPLHLEPLAPGHVSCQAVTATVNALYPAPQIEVRYEWQDARGANESYAERLALTPPQVRDHWLRRMWIQVPENAWSVLLGAAIALFTSWVGHRREKAMRERAAEKRVRGLLRFSSAQALRAAEGGHAFPMALLETALTGEGHYAAIEQSQLVDQALALCVQAERHNGGLAQSGGAERTEALRQAALALQKALQTHSARARLAFLQPRARPTGPARQGQNVPPARKR